MINLRMQAEAAPSPGVEHLPSRDGRPPMLVARAGQPWGAAVLLHEGFGLNGFVRSAAHRLARAGLTCVAPALFWRQGVTTVSYDEGGRAGALARSAEPEGLLDDIGAARSLASRMAPGPLLLAGWCFGGAAACLSAMAGTGFAATVAWYPVRLRGTWEAARGLGYGGQACGPLLLFMGGRDRFLPDDERGWLEGWAHADPHVVLRGFPDADHGFCNPERADLHHPAAAEASFAEALAFMRRHARPEQAQA